MIIFADIMQMLSKNGWSSYRLRNEKIFSESTMSRIRSGQPLNTTTIDKICDLCDCQPGDLMRFERDKQGS